MVRKQEQTERQIEKISSQRQGSRGGLEPSTRTAPGASTISTSRCMITLLCPCLDVPHVRVQDNPDRGVAVANAHRAAECGKYIPAPVVKKPDMSSARRAKEEVVEDPSGLVNNVLSVTEEDSTSAHIHVQTVVPGLTHVAPNVEERG